MEFKCGDLVWAKFDDYPYWPARIAKDCITEELREFRSYDGVAVLFFGPQLMYDLVQKENIKSFEENFDLYSKPKKLDKETKFDFEEAVKQARSKELIEDPPLELEEEKRITKKIRVSKSETKIRIKNPKVNQKNTTNDDTTVEQEHNNISEDNVISAEVEQKESVISAEVEQKDNNIPEDNITVEQKENVIPAAVENSVIVEQKENVISAEVEQEDNTIPAEVEQKDNSITTAVENNGEVPVNEIDENADNQLTADKKSVDNELQQTANNEVSNN